MCSTGCNANCSSTCGINGCTGCGGACNSDCTSCTGTCAGYCDNGCTATSMSEVYEALGKDIVLNAIVKASDVNEIESCIVRELSRRNISYSNETATVGSPISSSMKTTIHNNCVKGGYSTDESSVTGLSASQMQRYVTFIKELYKKIVVS